MPRRLPVERTIIGREQVFGEGKLRHHLLELAPEAPAHALTVLRQPVGRFETHGVIGRSHRGVPLKVPTRQIAAAGCINEELGMGATPRKIAGA
jgi:hypothetical protein